MTAADTGKRYLNLQSAFAAPRMGTGGMATSTVVGPASAKSAISAAERRLARALITRARA